MVQKYFNQLNYTLGNEDTAVDCEIVKRLGSKNVFSVAGCGSRSFPLLEHCDELHMVDVSEYQLSLCRLREALYKALSFEEFLLFFDFPPYHGQDNSYQRKKIFQSLELESRDRDYFRQVFNELEWQSLLYSGKWERTFQTMSKGLRAILGRGYPDLFEFHNVEDQAYFFKNKFNKVRWNALLFLLGNKSVFNALLYKGDFIEKNVEENHFEYYKQSFETLFTHNLARDSFFAHLCFFGEITHSDGNPIEAKDSNYRVVKEKIMTGPPVKYFQGDLVGLLESDECQGLYDFIGLSDVPSYFKGPLEENFIQRIRGALKPNGVICLRNYLRIPETNTDGLKDITDNFLDLYPKEKVGVYRFKLFQSI